MPTKVTSALVAAWLAALAGCGHQEEPAAKKTGDKPDVALAVPNQEKPSTTSRYLPPPILSLKIPPSPSPIAQSKDLREQPPELLRAMADAFVGENSYERAAQYQFWFVQRTDEGRYDLARCESIAGHVEEGFFWLQEAARLEGVN